MFPGLVVALLAVFAVVTTAVVSRSTLSVRVRWFLWSTALAGTITVVLCARGAVVREREEADERVFDVCWGFKFNISGYKNWLTSPVGRPSSIQQSLWWYQMVSSQMVASGWDDCMRKPVVCEFPREANPTEEQLDAMMKAFDTHDSCTPCDAFPDPAQRPRGCPN